jgi:MFS family permease
MKMDFNYDLITLAIPLLAISFGATPLQLGLLGALQRILYIIVCPISGRLSDRWGRKGFAVTGAILFALVCLSLSRAADVRSIFWIVPAVGLSLGLFWPALQSWLSNQGESQLLAHSTSLFNVSWSTGSMLGMILAGVLMKYSPKLPFCVAAGVAVLITIILSSTSQRTHSSTRRAEDVRQEDGYLGVPSLERGLAKTTASETLTGSGIESDWDQAQRRAALASIFLCFVVISSVVTQFPKLATQLGLSTSLIGLTMGFLPLTRTLGFGIFGKWKASQDISRQLSLAKLLAISATAVLIYSNSYILFMTAFALLGLVAALTFSLSQYLALKTPVRTGHKIGLHESSMLTGIVMGSILSGLIAQKFGFHWTFAFGLALSTLSLIVQPALFCGQTHRTSKIS